MYERLQITNYVQSINPTLQPSSPVNPLHSQKQRSFHMPSFNFFKSKIFLPLNKPNINGRKIELYCTYFLDGNSMPKCQLCRSMFDPNKGQVDGAHVSLSTTTSASITISTQRDQEREGPERAYVHYIYIYINLN